MDGIGVAAGDDRGGVGMRERRGDRVQNHEGGDAEQRDPDRPRDVARGVARFLRHAHAGVQADEHASSRMTPTAIEATTSDAIPILIVHLSSPMPKAPAADDKHCGGGCGRRTSPPALELLPRDVRRRTSVTRFREVEIR